MSREWPQGLEKYGETALFTEESVPAKLTSVHNTKAGVWGKLCVEKGALNYIVSSREDAPERIEAGQYGVIEPEVVHRVELIGAVAFRVEFYRKSED
ncbi:MAG: DUF1971 domain-containing protein [Pseudomonadales bacterium]|nr:DUF1971 domain-containing protein [Pseudomonadales bacterium]MCP5329586.1 DUF1971 domain-containing protein [Pseudomonadales bacterium]MCP5343875.1 DUF1971 domain-containing protein [Pseudomonadales bacterium]